MPSPQLEREIAKRAARDGCGCPPWVMRCVHFEGQIVSINDQFAAAAAHDCQRFSEYTSKTFAVGTSTKYLSCPDCEVGPFLNGCNYGVFPDLPSAQAEFDKRAEELRHE